VPWPLGGEHALVLARPHAIVHALPAPFVLWMLARRGAVLAFAPWASAHAQTGRRPRVDLRLPRPRARNRHRMAADPGPVGQRPFRQSLLALYHQGHFWLAMCDFQRAAVPAPALGRALAWLLSLVDGASTRVVSASAPWRGRRAPVRHAARDHAIAVLLLNLRQLTSELGRLWLMLGAAWFFFLRGTPCTERLARSGGSLGSLTAMCGLCCSSCIVLSGR
jgi:hypothetical protein